MGNPTPVGKDTTVAIAVKKGTSSQVALKWTIDNLMMEGLSVTLVHVRPRAKAFSNHRTAKRALAIEVFSGPEVRSGIDEGFKEILIMRAQEMLQPFQSYCQKKKIQTDVVMLEDDDPVVALANFVLVHQIDVLVMGTGSRNGILKKFKGPDVATRVSKKAPYFCTVYIIAKGRLLSVRSSSTTQALSDNNVNIVEHPSTYHEPPIGSELLYSGSSVTPRTALLPPDLEKESEFRSPLQNYGHSHFSSGGFSESTLDISFVSSDRQFFGGSSSGYSDNSSFTPLYASSNSSNWDLSSTESSHADSGCNSMDELQMLRLELIKKKNMYDSVCNEVPDAKMLSLALNQEDNQGMEKSQRSPYQAAITHITPRTAHGESQNDWRPNQKPPRPAFYTAP
ncbi:hypothetical protein QQ045_008084 [Rhodiola kirilowii]